MMPPQAPSWSNWLWRRTSPLRIVCFLACLLAAACGVGQIKRYVYSCQWHPMSNGAQIQQCAPRPFHLTIAAYSIVLSSFGCLLELGCCGPLERRVELWNKMLRRAWGRSALYLLISIMQFAQQTVMGNVAAGLLLAAAIFSLAVSCTATRKLSLLRGSLRTRLLDDASADTDEVRLRAAFDKIDADKSGSLEPRELARVAADLGVALTPEEMHAAFAMLDHDSCGRVSFEQFRGMWLGEAGYVWV